MQVKAKIFRILAPFLNARPFRSGPRILVVFGARNGDYYMDNSRALFEWYLSNRPEQAVLWLTKSEEVANRLKAQGAPVARIDRFSGYRRLTTAAVAVFSNRIKDVVLDQTLLPRHLKLVFLGHGQPVKKSRLTIKDGVSPRYARELTRAAEQIAIATTTSQFMADIQAQCQGVPRDRFVVTGLPSNDWLQEPPARAQDAWYAFIGDQKYNKAVLYAPTWRNTAEPTVLLPFPDLDIEKLARFLEDRKILFLIRPHIRDLLDSAYNKQLIETLQQHTSYVRLAGNDVFPDANQLLPFIDCLISDYSSIYHDYLLLNRPVYVVPYDYDTFAKTTGFEYDYCRNLPGPALNSQAELLHALERLMHGHDDGTDARRALTSKIHAHTDANSCARIAFEIDRLLESACLRG